MKKLFFSLVALMTATLSFAQNTLVATLSHGKDVSMYYGTYALRDALNAAQSGDVINLSGGAFQAVNITKGITLRGTGIDDAAPTYISGDFTINVPTNDANRLSIEGIRSTGCILMTGTFNNPYFVKCQFASLDYNYDRAKIKNAMFADCRISSRFTQRGSSTVQFINSYIEAFENQDGNQATASFINCILRPDDSGNNPEYIRSSQLVNCIIYQTDSSEALVYKLPSSSIATNCVSVGYYNLFDDQAASTGNKKATFTQLFKNFTGTYSESQQFELTDKAKTTYLGTDGTEVGIHGGLLPYDSTPSYPQITKMNVANKTTADGKLSVEIEVSAAE